MSHISLFFPSRLVVFLLPFKDAHPFYKTVSVQQDRHVDTHTFSLSLSHTHALSLSHTQTLTHTHIHLKTWTFAHAHTHILKHTHIHFTKLFLFNKNDIAFPIRMYIWLPRILTLTLSVSLSLTHTQTNIHTRSNSLLVCHAKCCFFYSFNT